MSSFDVVCMTEDIKNTFGIALKATDFIKFKTVGLMAEHIDNA
jgi:acyl carrier protein